MLHGHASSVMAGLMDPAYVSSSRESGMIAFIYLMIFLCDFSTGQI